MIKAIAFDMDGTLLNSQNEILPETKEILMKLQEQGIRLILSSGRSYTRLMKYAEELEMKRYGGFFVEINGTAIYDVAHNEREVLSQLSIEDARWLFQYFMKWDIEIIGQIDDGMYSYMSEQIYEEKRKYRKVHHIPEDCPWNAGPYDFIFDNREGYPKRFYIEDVEEIKQTINKVCVAYHDDVLREVTALCKQELDGKFWVGLTSPKWLEIMPLGVTKATGLHKICSQIGITMDDIMAFGDAENDIEMLESVGHGIVMGNALENIKQYGKEVTDTNDNNGIAKALLKHFDLRSS